MMRRSRAIDAVVHCCCGCCAPMSVAPSMHAPGWPARARGVRGFGSAGAASTRGTVEKSSDPARPRVLWSGPTTTSPAVGQLAAAANAGTRDTYAAFRDSSNGIRLARAFGAASGATDRPPSHNGIACPRVWVLTVRGSGEQTGGVGVAECVRWPHGAMRATVRPWPGGSRRAAERRGGGDRRQLSSGVGGGCFRIHRRAHRDGIAGSPPDYSRVSRAASTR